MHTTDWYVCYTNPWGAAQPPGGVAPVRADLELARYLEKKAAAAGSRPWLWPALQTLWHRGAGFLSISARRRRRMACRTRA